MSLKYSCRKTILGPTHTTQVFNNNQGNYNKKLLKKAFKKPFYIIFIYTLGFKQFAGNILCGAT